ncbi:MAG: endolytic transglycosylase MltG [Betaproteobacteria bacterium]|nr:endolytic transglycosylase MltG [Betaproteobacteria bacterium]
MGKRRARRTKPRRRPVGLLLAGFLGVCLGGLIAYLNWPVPLPTTPYAFTVTHGSSLKATARQLTQAHLLREPWTFVLLARALGEAADVKAGSYALARAVSPLELLRKVTQNDATQSEITFIDGWTFAQMRRALDQDPALVHESEGLSPAQIMQRLGARETDPEGLFFPDTYFFPVGMSDLSILARAYQAMQVHLAREWSMRAAGLPYTSPYQALIMASIIEKETGQPTERARIAAVFVNRLRLGMRLQSDPTVIYGLGSTYDGKLHVRDLTHDTPYNTYTRSGLPPTPIAMPGLASIHAALHPAQSKALYFVAKGNGTHAFSDTLAQHDRAVMKYQIRDRRGPRKAG